MLLFKVRLRNKKYKENIFKYIINKTMSNHSLLNNYMHHALVFKIENLTKITSLVAVSIKTVLTAVKQKQRGHRIQNDALKEIFEAHSFQDVSFVTAMNYLSQFGQEHSTDSPNVFFLQRKQISNIDLSKSHGKAAVRAFYEKEEAFDSSIGIKVLPSIVDFFVKKGAFTHKESLGVLLTSSDTCTVMCEMAMKAIASHQCSCVLAAIHDAESPKQLTIASARQMTKTTLWSEDDYRKDYAQNRIMAPPVILTKTDFYDLNEEFQGSINGFAPMPQFNMIPPRPGEDVRDSKYSIPSHTVLLLAAYSGTDVYAVFVDPTYGQFNPDAVISNFQKLQSSARQLLGVECNGLLCGAPIAFRVGTIISADESSVAQKMDEMVSGWIRDHGSVNLDGHTYGLIRDFKETGARVFPHKEVPLETTGIELRPALNNQKIEKVGQKREDTSRYPVYINGRANGILLKKEKLTYKDYCL